MHTIFREEAEACNSRLDVGERPRSRAADALDAMVSDCWAARREEAHRCLLLAERAMPIAQELRDIHAQATILLASANARASWRQFSEATALCQEAHYLALALEADRLEGWRLAIWAEIQFGMGNSKLAEVSLDEARAALSEQGDFESIAELELIFSSQDAPAQKQAI